MPIFFFLFSFFFPLSACHQKWSGPSLLVQLSGLASPPSAPVPADGGQVAMIPPGQQLCAQW